MKLLRKWRFWCKESRKKKVCWFFSFSLLLFTSLSTLLNSSSHLRTFFNSHFLFHIYFTTKSCKLVGCFVTTTKKKRFFKNVFKKFCFRSLFPLPPSLPPFTHHSLHSLEIKFDKIQKKKKSKINSILKRFCWKNRGKKRRWFQPRQREHGTEIPKRFVFYKNK